MLTIGSYTLYKGQPFIVTKFLANGTVQILSPGGQKLAVAERNLSPINCPPAKVVVHKDKEYLVTAKGLIISMTTAKVMQWGESNGDRKAILALV